MRYRRTTCLTAFLAALALIPLTVQAQRSIEVFGGGGFTSGDAKKWSGARLDDWNQTYYDGHAQLFLGKVLGARVGIEAGHNYLMWYRWNSCPGCISPVYGNRDVEASRLMAVFRFDSPTRLFAEFAGGMQFFEGGNDIGGFAGVGYRVPLMGKLELPIKLRAGMVLDSDANLFPVALSAGLAFRM